MKKQNVKEASSPHRKPSNLKANFQSKIPKSSIKQAKGFYHSTTSSQDNNKLLDNKITITEEKMPKTDMHPPLKIKLFRRDLPPSLDLTKLTPKKCITLINRLFMYLKKSLAEEAYLNIKKQFSLEVHRAIEEEGSAILSTEESKSSIFDYVASDKVNKAKGLKLSRDLPTFSLKPKGKEKSKKPLFIITSQDDEYNNEGPRCLTTLNAEESNVLDMRMQDKDHKATNNRAHKETEITQLKQSLFHLTKSRVKTPTIMKRVKMPINHHIGNKNSKQCNKLNNKTQSNSKSTSREHNHNKKNTHLCSSNTHRETVTPSKNMHQKGERDNGNDDKVLFSPKDDDSKSFHLFNGKLLSKLNGYPNPISSRKAVELNNSCNKREISIEAIDLLENSNTQQCVKSSVISNAKPISSLNSKLINKSSGACAMNQFDHKTKQIRTQYIDLSRSEDKHLSQKTDDMMKVIKMSLDDNLKYMFNFSYEHFLSKESGSQSKQSQDLNEISS